MIKPYFETEHGVLYHGDCLEIMPKINPNVIITDPVWPNARADIKQKLLGGIEPVQAFTDMLDMVNGIKRMAVQLGCDSDPCFLSVASSRFEFFRVAWLEYARPHYKGRLMYGSDVAYLYGKPPTSKPGQRVIPGRFIDPSSRGKEADHPCPRKKGHVKWLVHWWSERNDIILDPFLGSGTTAVACEELNRRWIGIEISEEYCEIAAKRIEKETKQLRIPGL